MVSGIYTINYKDLCLYVGQSKNIESRIKKHKYKIDSRKHLEKFNTFLEKNNIYSSDLLFELIEECESNTDILNSREIHWFNELSPKFYGKQPSSKESWSHSLETKNKISKTLSKKLNKNSVTCKMCGNVFYAKPSLNRRFCSNACSKKNLGINKRSLSKTQISVIKYMRFSGMSLKNISIVFNTYEVKIHRAINYS